MNTETKKEFINKLTQILNSQYQDGISRITKIRKGENRSIRGTFEDGDKIFDFVLTTDDKLEFKPVSGVDFAEDEDDEEESLPDAYSRQLQTRSETLVEDWMDNIRGMLEDSDDLQEFSEKLTQNYPDFNTEEITDLIASAMAASRLGGMENANS